MNPTLNGTSDEVQIVAAFKNYTPNGTVANNTAQGTGGIFSNTVSTTLTNGFVYSWADTIYTFKMRFKKHLKEMGFYTPLVGQIAVRLTV
ncbi:MAG: hypothetical protein IPH28_17030 [Cytophagaceae bacterium]|nr:hypothetical protein [Cytophagaceae bacterium]